MCFRATPKSSRCCTGTTLGTITITPAWSGSLPCRSRKSQRLLVTIVYSCSRMIRISCQSFRPPSPRWLTWSALWPAEWATLTRDVCRHSSIRSFTLARPYFAYGESCEPLFVLPRDARLGGPDAEKPARTEARVQFSRGPARDTPPEFRQCLHADSAYR